MQQLQLGIKGHQEITVTEKDTASVYGSGSLAVFGTPAMIALMEKTCLRSVAGYLPEGQGTVGTLVNVSHERATALGKRVWCESKLVEIDRRRLVFEVTAFDDGGVIGRGRHERFIIDNEKFMTKVAG